MRGRLPNISALALALALTAFAQEGGGPSFLFAPEGEEFVVWMPAEPLKVGRLLPFGGGARPLATSYEAAADKARFSVLSFEKSGAGVPATLGGLVEGLRHALLGAQTGDYVIEHERDLTLEGRAGKQFALRTGSPLGSVRVFEGERHFYVLIAFGVRAGEPQADRFFSSFTFAPQNPLAARRVGPHYADPSEAPPSFWPAISVTKSFGIVIGRPPVSEPTPAPKQTVIEGGVLNTKAISKPPPAYPPIARAARASGTVAVRIVVDEGGRVISAAAVSGHPLLQQAAVAAARQARFQPTRLGGRPAKVRGVITYEFVLK